LKTKKLSSKSKEKVILIIRNGKENLS